MELIPVELSMLSATGLVALSFVTSTLTATVGIGRETGLKYALLQKIELPLIFNQQVFEQKT